MAGYPTNWNIERSLQGVTHYEAVRCGAENAGRILYMTCLLLDSGINEYI